MTTTLSDSTLSDPALSDPTLAGAPPRLPAGTGRLLGAAAPDLATHLARNGPVPAAGPRLIDELERAGLTGRGGAAFPAYRKLAAVAAGRRPVVIGNAAEGEPASAKDRTLLWHAPHLVLDGLQLAAAAVGARRAYLYLPAELVAPVRVALAQRTAARVDRVPVELVEAPDTFVAGEETAVISRITGGAAIPKDKRVRPTESGAFGAPTLVQNVETLAHLALIARHGASWFRRVGTASQPGTFLATLGGAVVRPGVYEAAYGTPVQGMLALAGGATGPLRAVLVGGYHGAWLTGDQLGTGMDRDALRPLGASPGAGVLVALPRASCALVETSVILDYLAGQGAGQCGPCLHGLPRLAAEFGMLARRDRHVQRLTERIGVLSSFVERRGACHHPDGTARLARSALTTFADDVSAHLAGRCLATGENDRAGTRGGSGRVTGRATVGGRAAVGGGTR